MNFCFPKTNLKKVKWPGETAIDMGKNGDLCWHVCKCGATAHPLGGAEGSEAAISQPHKFWVPVWAQGSCAVRCVNQQQVSSVFRSRSLCWVFRAVGDLFSNRWHWNAHLSRPLVAGQGAETERQVGPTLHPSKNAGAQRESLIRRLAESALKTKRRINETAPLGLMINLYIQCHFCLHFTALWNKQRPSKREQKRLLLQRSLQQGSWPPSLAFGGDSQAHRKVRKIYSGGKKGSFGKCPVGRLLVWGTCRGQTRSRHPRWSVRAAYLPFFGWS